METLLSQLGTELNSVSQDINSPWPCAGCGVLVSLEESLCPACTAQLGGGGLSWADAVNSTVEESDEN